MASAGSEGQKKLALRVKSKKSQNAVLRDVDTKDTVEALLKKLSDLTGVPASQIAILKGFPPKRVSYVNDHLVESLGLQHQDTIIVELDTSGSPGSKGEEPVSGEPTASSSSSPPSQKMGPGAEVDDDIIEIPVVGSNTPPQRPNPAYIEPDLIDISDEEPGLLLRQIVPSDNSCLFTSVTFCLSGEVHTEQGGGSTFLRDMIANTVAADPVKFNEAILGRPNKDYVNWIKKPESWGGGIELSILAEFYGVQISVVDTQSLHISSFGEDRNFPQRMFLIYDGIHYDPLYYEPLRGGTTRTIFEINDAKMMDLAKQLAQEAKASNQFTDLKNFSLRCQICNTLLKGEQEAQAHAKKTTHTSFAEIIQKK